VDFATASGWLQRLVRSFGVIKNNDLSGFNTLKGWVRAPCLAFYHHVSEGARILKAE
jgi:hypothetical protein